MSEHGKGLWAVFWRMVLFTPLALLGVVAFVVVLWLTYLLPFLAVFAVLEGWYLLGLLSVVAWGFWLRFGGPVRRAMSEGFEYASL